jgi:hypothetical protein
MRQSNPEVRHDYYVYSAIIPTLANTVSATDIIAIEADANFVVQKLAIFADIAGAVQTFDSQVLPLLNITIQDSGSGRNLQDQATPVANIAGSGRLPFILPKPRLFKSKSNINVGFTNFSNATTYLNITLSFIGYKIFRL